MTQQQPAFSGAARLRLLPQGPPLTGHTGWVQWGAWGQVGDQIMLATGGADGTVRLWEPGTAHGSPLTGRARAVFWGAWGQVGDQVLLATGSDDGTVQLWDPATGTAHGPPLTGHTDWVRWGAWGQVGDQVLLATGSDDGTVRLWDPATGTAHGPPLTGRTGWIQWGAWGQVGDQVLLATGSDDGTVQLWDPATGTAHGPPLTGHTSWVRWGAWGQVGDQVLLATASDDGTVRLWDPATGTAHGPPLTGRTGGVLWGAWGQVGDQVLLSTGGDDGTVRLWDPATGTAHGPPLTGHTDSVRWGAWGQVGDQIMLATGSDDGTVRLWDPATGTAHGPPLTGHRGGVLWGAWGQVGDQVLLATGSDDGTVRRWRLAREVVVPRVPGYRSDTGQGQDLLGRSVDAVALADVITARSARPPLAVGLFGQWGEGKSLFLELLEEQVRQRAASAGPSDPIAHGSVRQVRFNAWHYAEADLWASIVAELFNQLSATGGPAGAAIEQRQQSRLASELIAARGIREKLATAESRLTDLQQATSKRRTELVLPEQARQQLLVLLGPAAAQKIDGVLAGRWSTVDATRRSVGGLLRALPRRYLAGAGVLGLLSVALLVWGLHWAAAIPAIGLVYAGGHSIIEAWQRARPVRDQLGAGWQQVQKLLDEQDRRLDTAIAVAQAEVDELRANLRNLTAAGQLAGLVEDRAGSSDYRQRLGLMTQIRQDFEHMARLLLEASNPGQATTDAAGDQLPRIDRIVIYIDDLDRCPPHRVVEVLEAIHLLLAVRLFVVVVAVDPRWLLRSLTSHYQQLFARTSGPAHHGATGVTAPVGEDELWAATPAQYLEKIFQIVLTIAPMDQAGYQRMIADLLSLRADATPEPPATVTPTSTPTTGQPTRTQPATPPPSSPRRQPEQPRTSLEALPVVERVDPLALTAEELSFLNLLGPPLITGPRAVKRLANSYGLLIATTTARSGSLERLDLQPVPDLPPHPDCYPYRAALVLLAAVIGYPMLGPSFFPDLYHAAHANPTCTWTDYLMQIRPSPTPTLHSSLESPISPTRAQHWATFVDTLQTITQNAADQGLPLPHRLGVYADWVQPVGRLSFPTGAAVTALNPQEATR